MPTIVENANVATRSKDSGSEPAGSVRNRPTYDEIATLAYQLWRERGDEGGYAEQDWLRAEHLLSERLA